MALSETLYGKTPEQLAAVCAELGMPRFAAKQLARWLYAKHVEDPMRMSDIAAAHRAKLAERFRPAFTPPARITESADGTKKYLYRTQQGAWIESAYIPDGERATLCVSSQAGCRMGCKFCATGRQGLQHSLTTAEILNQIVSLPERDTLTNVVFMGMGEPLDNTDNGHEFQDRQSLEYSKNGEVRTRIYYCDPNRSDQKGALEKNHEYIRYVLPKGTSFEKMTDKTTLLLLNHINSEKRDSLNGHSPYEVSRLLLDNRLHKALGLAEIPADEVTLIPALIK